MMTELTHEQALIGVLLYFADRCQPQLQEVQPKYFSDKECREACRVMHELDRAGIAINRITVLPRLGISEEDTDDRFMVAVDKMRTRGDYAGSPPFFSLVDAVRRGYAKRQIAQVSQQCLDMAGDPATEADDIVKHGMDRFNEIDAMMQLGQKTGVRFDDGMEQHIERQEKGTSTARVRTGLVAIDNQLTGGLPVGGLTMLGGHPSMGKTALITQFALNAARSGQGVSLISMEMTEEQTFARLASSMIADTNVSSPYKDQLAAEGLLHQDPQALQEAVRHWRQESGLPLYADFRPACRVADIAGIIATARREFREIGMSLDLVIVDYLQEMPGTEDTSGTAKIVSELKVLAKRENVALVVLSQLNRNHVKDGHVNKPGPGAMLNAGASESHADVVMFIHRESFNNERSEDELMRFEAERRRSRSRDPIDIILSKVRNGVVGEVQVLGDLANNRITDDPLNT